MSLLAWPAILVGCFTLVIAIREAICDRRRPPRPLRSERWNCKTMLASGVLRNNGGWRIQFVGFSLSATCSGNMIGVWTLGCPGKSKKLFYLFRHPEQPRSRDMSICPN